MKYIYCLKDMLGIYKEKWILIHFVPYLMSVNPHIPEYKKTDKLNH